MRAESPALQELLSWPAEQSPRAAKKRPAATFDLAGSNVLSCSIDDLEGARDALVLSGSNDNGYVPLVEAIG